MTNRVTLPPQDFQKMCKQAERDQEAKKLVSLMQRVKRQIAERENPGEPVESPKRPVAAMSADRGMSRAPSRSGFFER